MGQAARIRNYPLLKSRIEEHLEETKEPARRLEICIERRCGGTSALKDIAGQVTALGQNFVGVFSGDEVIKGALASYTFEHMEIASYSILIAAAEEVGDRESAGACRQNLAEEQAMADWLADNIGRLTREYLDREENEFAEAKR
jgi:ferritin-like metal-binding protein YciE